MLGTAAKAAKKTNNGYSQTPTPPPTGPPSFHIGNRVEALKFTDEGHDWYCARIVTVEPSQATSSPSSSPSITENSPSSLFVHYEGWAPEHADWVSPSSIRQLTARCKFGPKGKESNASWEDYRTFYHSQAATAMRHHTGLVQDPRMLRHNCPCHYRKTHPEHPERIGAILEALHSERYAVVTLLKDHHSPFSVRSFYFFYVAHRFCLNS